MSSVTGQRYGLKTPPAPCQIQLSEVFKVNAFKREACCCEPEATLFTRDSIYNVTDSKRSPHVGSCKGDKCGIINSSTLIPELEQGNRYPGNTACVESCGGPGCDCFFISSGCLFYRIYMVPIDEKVYEILHCNRWREAANIEITHFDGIKWETSTISEKLIPNIPKKWKSLTFTLTSLSFHHFGL
ncbi:hypothetical protein COOONC_01679 [Cooperia oncophora]